jgi:rod shape-determining protein MreC
MESVLGRYRNLIVLVGVLFVQVLGLAVQVKRTTDTDSSRLIRVWAVGAVTPLEKCLGWAQASTRNLWHNYFYLRGVRAENRELKQQIERMRIEQVRMSQDADQARRLQVLLAFKEQFISATMAAQVIGSSGSEQSRSIYLDKGEKNGIKPDMAVITADGIVGKVLHVYHSTCLVLMINDQTSGVGAILEKSRLQGILRGTPSGEVALEKVMSDEQVPIGELLLTSGGDRIFPKGLPIGRVMQVSPPKGSEPFLMIQVKPSANLSKLEEVLVVTKIDERQATPDQTVRVRAADVLAERLPTVPPKPADAANGTAPAAAPQSGAGAAAKPADAKPKTSTPAAPATNRGTPQTGAGAAAKPADAKPKTSPPPATAANSGTAMRKAVTPSAGTGAAAAPAGSSAAKISQKPAKPPVTPQPQPPAQDPPQ